MAESQTTDRPGPGWLSIILIGLAALPAGIALAYWIGLI